MFRFSRRRLTALLGMVFTLFAFVGCDLLTVADAARKNANADGNAEGSLRMDHHIRQLVAHEGADPEWGPFRMGMSLEEVQAIVKSKTGKPGKMERLPGSKWDRIDFEDKMLMLMDGVLMTVMLPEPDPE
jgi:hypothetical protein